MKTKSTQQRPPPKTSGARHEPSVTRKAAAAHPQAQREGRSGGSTGQRSKHDR